MPDVPIRQLSIYDSKKSEIDTPTRYVGEPTIGTHLYKVMKFIDDVKETASTPGGRIKLGTIAASPLLGLLLARKRRNGLAKFTSVLCTTGVTLSFYYPSDAKRFVTNVSNYTMIKYEQVSANQRRLFSQIQGLDLLTQNTAHRYSISDEEAATFINVPVGGDKVSDPPHEVAVQKDEGDSDDDVVIDIAKHFPALMDDDEHWWEKIIDGEKNDDDDGSSPDTELVPDIFIENSELQSTPVFDFGQSTTEDEDMFPARSRE